MSPDAMSLSYQFGVNSMFFSFNVSGSIALTGHDGAFVFGYNLSKGVNSPKGIGITDGFQLAFHNNYGGNTDVLSGLGGASTGYAGALGLYFSRTYKNFLSVGQERPTTEG